MVRIVALLCAVILLLALPAGVLAKKPLAGCPASASGFVHVDRDGWWDRTVEGFVTEGIPVYAELVPHMHIRAPDGPRVARNFVPRGSGARLGFRLPGVPDQGRMFTTSTISTRFAPPGPLMARNLVPLVPHMHIRAPDGPRVA
jgi:hypothetical protein